MHSGLFINCSAVSPVNRGSASCGPRSQSAASQTSKTKRMVKRNVRRRPHRPSYVSHWRAWMGPPFLISFGRFATKVPCNVGSRGVPVNRQLMVFLLRIGSANSSKLAARRVGISASTVPAVAHHRTMLVTPRLHPTAFAQWTPRRSALQ